MRTKIVTPRIGSGTEIDPYRSSLDRWGDVTGQPAADIVVSKNAYTVEADLTDAQLAAIQADPQYVIVSVGDRPADLTQAQMDALKTKLATVYNLDVVDLITKDSSDPAVIASTLITAQKRTPWKAGTAASVGQIYMYDNNLYEVIQAHTTQADWTPPVAKALFKRYYEPADRPWPWVQPTGAHDAYPVGARVTHGGYTWRNDNPANVFAPGVAGWTNLTPPPPTSAWAYPVAYKINDVVTYNGSSYKCLQAHTSQAGWTPPAVPALWQLVS